MDIGASRRLATVMAAICYLTVGCGDGDGMKNGAGDVEPGFFIGETAAGGDLSIAVGSIRAVFFRCGTINEYRRFDPPEPVAGDGSFAVEFDANGRSFTVSGAIVDGDRIVGAIAGNPDCDGAFDARRCDPATQNCGDSDGDLIPDEIDPNVGVSPTPAGTPTSHTTSVVPTVVATPTAATSPTGAAATPSQSPAPAATATPTGPCGNGVLDEDEECDGSQIDNSFCFEDVCTCEDFCDDAGGALSCNANCTLNFSQCANGPCEF